MYIERERERDYLKILDEGDMKYVTYWGPTDIGRHRKKFSRPGYL